MYASASISVIFLNEHAQIYKDGCNLVPRARVAHVTLIEMAAFRAAVNSRFPDDEDSCMSCLGTTKYCCLRCKFPLCNKCSVPEENEETPGWKAGKSVAYCEPCSKEVAENGGNLKPKQLQRIATAPSRYRCAFFCRLWCCACCQFLLF